MTILQDKRRRNKHDLSEQYTTVNPWERHQLLPAVSLLKQTEVQGLKSSMSRSYGKGNKTGLYY